MGSDLYIVTGGGGFVGRALALRLRASGCRVISLSRGLYPELTHAGIDHRRVDLSTAGEELTALMGGAQAVFHTAAKVDMWGKREDFVAANVRATERLLRSAKQAKVPKFIFTSSPAVVADGSDLRGIDESYPYPKKHLAYYPETKALAEQIVLSSNCPELRTVALRPHLIFGPGDTNLIPTILERAKAGRLVQVGAGQNKSDVCFIEDCVSAHLNACSALDVNPKSSGRAYFISQGEPIFLWAWINEVLRLAGLPPVTRHVPRALAGIIAGALEHWCAITKGSEPLLTRFLVKEMATDHYFNIAAARKELGYSPKHSVADGLRITFAAAGRISE